MGSRALHSGQWPPNNLPMRNCYGTTLNMARTAKTKAQPSAISTAKSLPITHTLTFPWQGCLGPTNNHLCRRLWPLAARHADIA